MKARPEDTRLAEQAIKRAAKNLLGEAVRKNEASPIWNGKEVVWEMPTWEFEQMNVPDAPSSRR